MTAHQPPCETAAEHLDLEIGDDGHEGLDEFVSRFMAERDEETIEPVDELEMRYAWGDR